MFVCLFVCFSRGGRSKGGRSWACGGKGADGERRVREEGERAEKSKGKREQEQYLLLISSFPHVVIRSWEVLCAYHPELLSLLPEYFPFDLVNIFSISRSRHKSQFPEISSQILGTSA